MKLQAFRLATLFKRDTNRGVFSVNIAKFLRTAFLWNSYGGCFCVKSLFEMSVSTKASKLKFERNKC